MRRRKQRCVQEPRNASSFWNLEEARNGFSPEPSKRNQPCKALIFILLRLILEFWSPELEKIELLLFKAVKFMAVCYAATGDRYSVLRQIYLSVPENKLTTSSPNPTLQPQILACSSSQSLALGTSESPLLSLCFLPFQSRPAVCSFYMCNVSQIHCLYWRPWQYPPQWEHCLEYSSFSLSVCWMNASCDSSFLIPLKCSLHCV